jgi:hypothetical protein
VFYISGVLNNLPVYLDGSDRIAAEIFQNFLVRKHAAVREHTPGADPKTSKRYNR